LTVHALPKMEYAETNAKLRLTQKELLVAKTLISLSMADLSVVRDAYFSNMLGLAQVQRRYILQLLPYHDDTDLDWLFANVIETVDAIKRQSVDIIVETTASQADFLFDLLNDRTFSEAEHKTLLLVRDAHYMTQRYLSHMTYVKAME
jgi:hypothetical protein